MVSSTRAAELLQISLKTLHNKLRLYRDRGQLPEAEQPRPTHAQAARKVQE
jgi:hypothetical protein